MSMSASAPQKDEEAQLKYAAISREQWGDYLTRFRPEEDKLIESIDNSSIRAEEIGRANTEVDRAYETTGKNAVMRAGRTGGMNAEQREAMERRLGLGKAVKKTTTTNNVRQDIKDRDTQILSGMINVGRGVKGEAMNGLASSARMESQRNNTNTQIAANNTAGRWGLAGTGAGLAVMAGV